MKQSVSRQSDLSFANSAAAAVLYQSPRGGQLLLWSIMLFVLLMLAWSWYAEVDEFTRGEGRVIPSSSVQVVQNLEGGIVAEIMVQEGELVERDQPLMRLKAARFTASLRESEVSKAQLNVKAVRLLAEARGESFSGEGFADAIPADIIRSEVELYQARARELDDNRRVIAQQQKQKRQELSELKAKVKQLQRSRRLLQQEVGATEPLVRQGAASRVELLRLRRQENDLAGELEATRLAIPRIEAQLAELSEKDNADLTRFRAGAQADYQDVQSELARLVESSQAVVDQVDRSLITSPVKGTVKQLFVKTLGGVVQPGKDLVAIVPSEDRLLIEAEIRPADIAFLHPGQEATVKFTAYDFSIHGGLGGKVVTISPDTIVDEEGQSHYLVQVETDKPYLGDKANPLPIIPGMIVNTDIITGKKSILDYLLKPILKTRELALRER